MNRRKFLSMMASGASASVIPAISGAVKNSSGISDNVTAENNAKNRPNILWICTDQQRWDTINSLGNKHIRTPNLDKLAASGAAFTHAHCQSPICTPSRASFLTGMYPDTVHACINGNDYWDDAAPLITKTLADAGYDCGLSGKFHLSAADGRIEPRVNDGYKVFHWSHHPADSWPEGHAYEEWLNRQGTSYNEQYKKFGYIPTPLHQTTWCTDMAIEFMTENRDAPWLFSLNCFDPHPPHDPPREYLDRYDVESMPGPLFHKSDIAAQRRLKDINFQSDAADPAEFNGKLLQVKYWAQIELIDDNVGRLLKTLEETGQRDNTIIIFTSDHGNTTGDHGMLRKGCRFYEGLVRVPLIISWPETIKRRIKSEALVELTDIVPTLLEAVGLPVPDSIQGKSLLPILTGESAANHHRDYVRSVYYKVLDGTPSYAAMIRNHEYKITNYHGHGLGELFDMKNDPGEFNNLWDDPKYKNIRFELMTKNFDETAFAIDTGPPRVGRY